MSSAQAITNDYPVVYFSGDAAGGGWYFRGVRDENVCGPFRKRAEAVAFALEKLSEASATPQPKKAQRRAA